MAAVSRDRVLRALQDAPGGLDAEELGTRVRLHPNTVRWHLGALAREGFVTSAPEERHEPGRPRVVFRATPRADERPQDYRLLAGILTGLVASEPDAATRSEEAGRAWGRYVVEAPPPFAPVDEEQVGAKLEQLLESEGFEPTRDGAELRMHRCPFHELALQHTEVVCSLHRGLLDGALAELGSRRRVKDLRVFASPSLCVARLG